MSALSLSFDGAAEGAAGMASPLPAAPPRPEAEITPEQWAAYEQYAQEREAAGRPIRPEYDARLLAQSPHDYDRSLAAHYLRHALRGPWRAPEARINRRLVKRHARKRAARREVDRG